MSVPPSNPRLPTGADLSFNSAPVQREQSIPQTGDPEWTRTLVAVQRAINDNIILRGNTLTSLPSELKDLILSIQRDLPTVYTIASSRCDSLLIFDSLSSEDDDSEIEKQIEEKTEAMKKCITDLIEKYSVLQIGLDWFSDWWNVHKITSEKREVSLQFMKEQLINRFIDQVCFLNETTSIVKMHQSNIIRFFYSEALADQTELSDTRITFQLFLKNSETHNCGKVPTRVDFYQDRNKLFSIFFKPRDAQIDRTIVQTFLKLNELTDSEKSSTVKLPVYKIGVSDEHEPPFSFWEFIEGEHAKGGDAAQFVEGRAPNNIRLREQLMRLESVCRFLEISDLHADNIIFSKLGQADEQIVPIDLESVQPGATTGLGTMPGQILPFTPKEEEILTSAKRAMKTLTARFVPIPTSHFLGALTRCDSFIRITNLIIDEIQSKGYNLSIKRHELELMVLTNFLHNDIPYLTINADRINFGAGNSAECIAMRKP